MPSDAQRRKSELFPLPLTAFEHYMLADDRAAYPMNFFVRLRFSGRFDRTALEQAMSQALSRHRLLSAVVYRSRRGWFWRAADTVPSVGWLDASPAEALPHLGPIDIRREPGVRVVACAGPGRTDLVVQGHHTASDGAGIYRFIEDLLLGYAHVTGVVSTSLLSALSTEQLRRRGWLGRTARQWPRALLHQTAALPNICRFAGRVSQPLPGCQPAREDDVLPSVYPASHTCRLSETQTAEVLATARAGGVTVNDLLTQRFFGALASRLPSSSDDPQKTWLRVGIPVNLRTPVLDRLPAANLVSFAFLMRSLADIADSPGLLRSVHAEMQRAKRLDRVLTFVLTLGLCRRLPGAVEWICGRPRCMTTGVLTNLGRLFVGFPLIDEAGRVAIGDLVLEGMDNLSPWRPLTPVAVAAWSYAGRLCFTLHYDRRVLSADEARRLLDGFGRSVGERP